MLPAPELVKDFFLGLFADRAGIEQNNIRVCGIVCGYHLMAVAEQIAHTRRIVLIHLAAMSYDMELFNRFFDVMKLVNL